MKSAILPFLLFVSFSIYSQDITPEQSSVVVHKDPRLDMLVKKHVEINEEISKNTKKSGKGFRLLVVNTNKRDEAINAKAKLYQFFPELKSYLYYQSPYFKLKAGNFMDRKEAETYQKKLNKYFPNGVFVMADIIEIRPQKETEE